MGLAGKLLGHKVGHLLAKFLVAVAAFLLGAGLAHVVGGALACNLVHKLHNLVRRLRMLGHLALRHLELGNQLALKVVQLADMGVSKLQCVHEQVLADLLRFPFHHHDRIIRAGDDNLQFGLFHLRVGRVDDELAVDIADANVGDGAFERHAGKEEGAGGADCSQNIRRVFLIEGHHVADQLGFVGPALSEHRADRAVDQTGRKDFMLAGSRLALEEPSGDLAGRCILLAILHLQRQEVDAVARGGGGHRNGQQHRVAVADHHGRVGKLGIDPGFQGERSAADFAADGFSFVLQFHFHRDKTSMRMRRKGAHPL